MKKKYIHFVGIKGVGMTPIAIMAKEAGYTVTGSDIADEFITDAALKKAGIIPLKNFSSENIKSPDLIITSGANGGFDNIEVVTAKKLEIPVITQGQAVGNIMNGQLFEKKLKGISVSGTHGKTTTAAILATVLMENKYDPSYVIGTGNVGSLPQPGHLGNGSYFIAEADEYATEPLYNKRAKFLWQEPYIGIITNIEFDHPDIYSSIDQVSETFFEFANNIKDSGVLVACGDDHQIKTMLKKYQKRIITYGFNPQNNFYISRLTLSGDQTFFWVNGYGTSLGEFVLRVSGEHNALNALAVIITAQEIGISLANIKKSLLAFKGSKRRLEYIGNLKTGAKVYDDYAHHPTEIKKTLSTLRRQYPKNKIICIFQPHTYSRTKALYSDFLRSFDDVDQVILTDIYPSRRELPDPSISSLMFSVDFKKHHKDAVFIALLTDVVEYINKNRYRSDVILVTMGAGDVYTIHSSLQFL